MTTSTRRLVTVLVAGAALVAAFVVLPLGAWAIALVEWIRGAGAAGVVVLAAVYVGAALLLLPGSLLTLGAGFAYGPLWGALLVSPVSVIAATLAFALGRTFLGGWVAAQVAERPRFAAVDRAIDESGFKIVLLLRLSPVFPYSLTNYALGLTRIGLGKYALASFLGMLPGTVLYVYLGSLVTSASQLARGKTPDAGPWGQALYWGGLGCALVVTVIVTRIARRALRSSLAAPAASPPREA